MPTRVLVLSLLLNRSFSSDNRVHIQLYSQKWTIYVPGKQGIFKKHDLSFYIFRGIMQSYLIILCMT